MLIVPVKEGENIERALKRFKQKFNRTGKMHSLRHGKHFAKPSIERRQQKLKARYIQHLRDQQDI